MILNEKEVTLDDLQNGYFIYQPADGFRFGVDAVLISHFANVKPNEKVLDMGTGTGIIPILLAARTKERSCEQSSLYDRSARTQKQGRLKIYSAP